MHTLASFFHTRKKKKKKTTQAAKKLLRSIKKKGPLGKKSPFTREEKSGQ